MVDPDVLSDFIKKSGLKYRNGANSYIFTCPICNKKDKLYIRKKDGLFCCFYCRETENFKGSAEFALSKLTNTSVKEVSYALYGTGEVQFHEFISIKFKNAPFNDYAFEDLIEEETQEQETSLPELVWPIDFVGPDRPIFQKARNYLYSRGINEYLIEQYSIKYQPEKQRVIFPVIVNGELLGWQGRYTENTEILDSSGNLLYKIPKILTSKGLSGGKYFMFQDRVKGSEHAFLTEGPVDAIKCHLCGGNIASMGKSVSKGQISSLVQTGIKKLYLGLDPDAATDTARIAKEISSLSNNEIKIYLVNPYPGREDMGDCTLEEVREQFEKAELLSFPRIFIYFKQGEK